MRVACLILLLLSEGLCFCRVTLAAELTVHNTFVEPIYFWTWPFVDKVWIQPPPYLPKNGRRNINIDTAGYHFVVVVDEAGRERQIGWRDFQDYARRNPGQELVLDGYPEERTRTYKVTKYRLETRTMVCHGKERIYTVRVPYSEERTQVYTVWIPYLRSPTGEVFHDVAPVAP